MAHLTEIRFGKVARALAAASLLAMAVIAVPAGQAHAAQNNGSKPGTSSLSCTDPDGNSAPAGTIWTSTTQNGQVASRYRCNGKTGEWDRIHSAPQTPSTPKAPTTGTKKAF